MRDVAVSPDGATAYVVEERTGRLLAVAVAGGAMRELARCHGPVEVRAIAGWVAVNCLLDHAIEVRRADGNGEVARIAHDGPLWSFAVHAERGGGLLVAATGIEDHPLVREDGGFGYIDSFVYVYRIARDATRPTRLAAVNVSELGVVTPKWIALAVDATGGVRVTTAGYATPSLLELSWPDNNLAYEPIISHTNLPPGTAAADLGADGTLVAANPLLDAWVVMRGDGAAATAKPEIVHVASAQRPRSVDSRVGELLMFTTMMAPWNSSQGALSRFTCEACHFEGYVDGRVHFTGRSNGADKVHATSRPLYGLFNNRPHFSRALDTTTTKMVHAEFRVANRHNGRDPWFDITRGDMPWLAELGMPARLAPVDLRRSLMAFLADFSHRTNAAAVERTRFSDEEARGARVFRDRCARCHAARLVADSASSLVPFERWEALVLSASGPIVWSDAAYAKTGVVPYVHAEGARVPTLRRLYKKWPYFTNGSARSLGEVLDRFAWDGERAWHDRAPATAAKLSGDDKDVLRAFLELL